MNVPPSLTGKCWTASIVSHGHRVHVEKLVAQLQELCCASLAKIVVTFNLADEVDDVLSANWSCGPVPIEILTNQRSQGFAANQNAAFLHCDSTHFAIVNPDVVISEDPFPALANALTRPSATLSYPRQRDGTGKLQDYERSLPSPLAIFNRHFAGRLSLAPRRDWVSGAFMALRSEDFREIGGFSELFHMYCEDVDLCLRVQLRGGTLEAADTEIIHLAQRASRKRLRFAGWHIGSLLRLWTSAVYWRYLWQQASTRRNLRHS
jgi:N-acetylglucosaminyl-diphospho-decaprenol L-rhamnosyltransferase